MSVYLATVRNLRLTQSEHYLKYLKPNRMCSILQRYSIFSFDSEAKQRKRTWQEGKIFPLFQVERSNRIKKRFEWRKKKNKHRANNSVYVWIGVAYRFLNWSVWEHWVVSDNEVVGGGRYWINLLNVNNIVIYRSNASRSQLHIY